MPPHEVGAFDANQTQTVKKGDVLTVDASDDGIMLMPSAQVQQDWLSPDAMA